MLVSLKWLKDYVDLEISPAELAQKLTMAGLEVDSIKEVTPGFSGVVAAKIISILPHPDAQKLHVCEVSTGSEVLPIVCGAPNITVGQIVPLALIGSVLPGGYTIKSSKIRGVQSEGMLCSEEELGIGSDNTGIMILPDSFKTGDDLSKSLDLKDFVLDVGVTPNRSDCLSIIGIAREAAVLTGTRLKYPAISFTESTEDIRDITSVSILDPQLCPRYTARLIKNVQIGPSPLWMRQRLEAVGLRSINNVVDVTNFVMMEFGQPLHAFDFRYLEEGRIVVRKSREREEFVFLDGKSRALTANTLMICDGKKPVAVAGIMGGLNSEVQPDTRTVLLESAYFNPVSIRRSSKQLGMSTDAAFRFERGIDPEGVVRALNRAAQLIAETAGGCLCKGLIDEYPNKLPAVVDIELRASKVSSTLGIDAGIFEIKSILEKLEMKIRDGEEGRLFVTPPTFRTDIYREIDLIEEFSRIHGFEKIPESLPAITVQNETRGIKQLMDSKLRTAMIGSGYREVINYSFITPSCADLLGLAQSDEGRRFIRIMNPLSEDQSVMRTNLVYGLLEDLRRNVNLGSPDLKLFEKGKIFIARGPAELPIEREKLGVLLSGSRHSDFWRAAEESDIYDLKGCLEGLFDILKIDGVMFRSNPGIPYLHPGRSAVIEIQGRNAGFIGEIHPQVLEKMDIRKRTMVFELDYEVLESFFQNDSLYKEIPRFPGISRDVAFLVNDDIEADKVIGFALAKNQKLLEKIEVFDVYTGTNIPEGTKSLALRFTYRSPEKTLTDDEVGKIHAYIVKAVVDATSAKIRGE